MRALLGAAPAAVAAVAAVAADARAAAAAWDTTGPVASVVGLGFRADGAEAYSESISLSSDLEGGRACSVTLAVGNVGVGDGEGAVRSYGTLGPGRKRQWSQAVGGAWRDRDGVLTFGATRVARRADGSVHLWHEAKEYSCDLTFRPSVAPWRPHRGRVRFSGGIYEFALPVPLAEVAGKMRIDGVWQPVRGYGQIDHSRTNQFAHEQATRWYRLRSVTEPDGAAGRVLVQLTQLVPAGGGAPLGWLLVAGHGKVVHESYDYRLELADRRPDPKRKEYQVPLRYEIHDARLRGTARAPKISSRTDYLEGMNALTRLVVGRFAKPIGYGLEGTFEAKLDLPGLPAAIGGRGWMSQTFVK